MQSGSSRKLMSSASPKDRRRSLGLMGSIGNKMMTINDVEIEHGGVVKTIGDMVADLKTGHASYWHWHTVFTKTIRLYNSAKKNEEYGILLPDVLVVKGKSIGLLECEISQGGYNRECLLELVKMFQLLRDKSRGL